MTALTPTAERPLRVAIVGSGPSGFYAAEALLKQAEHPVLVDVFERLPTPYGLVRAGVAPDHQSVKQVSRIYESRAQDPRFRFFGHAPVGEALSAAELRDHYDAVIYAVGNEGDRRLGVPGEYGLACAPSSVFVGWYNAHPDYCTASFGLDATTALVVGNGNVAGDVTRVLARSVEALAKTDIAEHALVALEHSQIREVLVLGRSGPLHATFTPKELAELGALEGADVVVDPADLVLCEADQAQLEQAGRNDPARKNYEILKEFSERARTDAPRVVRLKFYRAVQEVLLDEAGRIRGAVLLKNAYVTGPDGATKLKATGETETVLAQMMLTAIGFEGRPIEGVPFDEKRKTIANLEGRVVTWPEGERVPHEYVVGWAMSGPRGQIGMHKGASAEVVAKLLADLKAGEMPARELPPPDAIAALLHSRSRGTVTFHDWKVLDEAETSRGARRGAPRVKFAGVDDMLAVMGKTPAPL